MLAWPNLSSFDGCRLSSTTTLLLLRPLVGLADLPACRLGHNTIMHVLFAHYSLTTTSTDCLGTTTLSWFYSGLRSVIWRYVTTAYRVNMSDMKASLATLKKKKERKAMGGGRTSTSTTPQKIEESTSGSGSGSRGASEDNGVMSAAALSQRWVSVWVNECEELTTRTHIPCTLAHITYVL